MYFKANCGEIWAKLAIFHEILTLNLVIQTNFWGKFGLYLAFFETDYGKIWPFYFFGPGNPGKKDLEIGSMCHAWEPVLNFLRDRRITKSKAPQPLIWYKLNNEISYVIFISCVDSSVTRKIFRCVTKGLTSILVDMSETACRIVKLQNTEVNIYWIG